MSYSSKKSDPGVDLEDLEFYFDAIAKDRYDQGMLGRRNGQVLALRERLLSLPEGEFDMAIRTIEKLVADIPGRTPTLSPRPKNDVHKQARLLYEKVDAAAASSHSVSADKLQKI